MKVILITGTSSGIGLSMGQYLAKAGHHVYGISRRKVFDESFTHIQADIKNEEEIKNCIQDIIDKEGRIDVLINNAGSGISGTIEDTELEDAKSLFDVNFFGSFLMIKYVLPLMREQRSGHIYNVSSLASHFPLPFQAFYSSSKAALTNFSWALQNEVKPLGIQVCTILPGDIKTGFTKSRQKNKLTTIDYGARVKKSIQVMEKDEQNGMSPDVVSKALVKFVTKKKLPLEITFGFKYRVMLFLKKRFSAQTVNLLIGKIYGFFTTKE
jgi:short-subunit dehydrogenase